MLDDLEEKHKIVGKTNKEIINLVGQPTYISNVTNVKYEYYVGESIIDPLGYQIEFENNIFIDIGLHKKYNRINSKNQNAGEVK